MIKKYRSVEEMPGARPPRPLDPENLRIACELSELAYALHPWKFEPGVRKFRSIEEADEGRRGWERDQIAQRCAAQAESTAQSERSSSET